MVKADKQRLVNVLAPWFVQSSVVEEGAKISAKHVYSYVLLYIMYIYMHVHIHMYRIGYAYYITIFYHGFDSSLQTKMLETLN